MSQREEISTVMICLSICAMDGVITDLEEKMIFSEVSKKFDLKETEFEALINEFFNSDLQLEDYARSVEDAGQRQYIAEVSRKSASVDGFAIKENIAWQKLQAIWGLI